MTAWLNPADAAEMLGVTESVIRDTCERTKLLQCKDVGSKGMHYWRVSLPSLLDWEGRTEAFMNERRDYHRDAKPANVIPIKPATEPAPLPIPLPAVRTRLDRIESKLDTLLGMWSGDAA